jgi:hypothetical protein
VRAPEHSGSIHRFFGRLKEQLLWVRRFEDVEGLGKAWRGFRNRCNEHWLVERLQFQPPRQARQRVIAPKLLHENNSRNSPRDASRHTREIR